MAPDLIYVRSHDIAEKNAEKTGFHHPILSDPLVLEIPEKGTLWYCPFCHQKDIKAICMHCYGCLPGCCEKSRED
ncbi:hypothetical protein BGX33_012440 [Mortierella sp. NVP41]|nr:hypothetical protein BGX33_012440 [Mortierella sp. NVP41]